MFLGLDPDIFGAIWLDSGKIIIDESLDPEERPAMEGRYRFTLAHEGGGHWRLHRGLVRPDRDQEALFADVPKPTVICRSSQSPIAMRIRLENLGLLLREVPH